MSDEVLIKVEDLSKKFCRSLKRSLWYGVQDIAGEMFGRNGTQNELRTNEFWSVKDVSFELRRGECLGLIGRNGAGKTTLLRMLNGLIKPDRGRIEMRGWVGALIALGAGFNPILTGRENIYVNGAVLGLSKEEIDSLLSEIVEFSGIGKFIDTPVQSYSSGMVVRLGFSVAAHLQPSILLIDEVLAVGDAEFRGKCYNKIDSLRSSAAVIFVSHSMEQIGRICDKILLLDAGTCVFLGDTGRGMSAYRDICRHDIEGFIKCYEPITASKIVLNTTSLSNSESLLILVSLHSLEATHILPRIVIFDSNEQIVAEGNSRFNELALVALHPGENTLDILLEGMRLLGGEYYISVNVHDSDAKLLVHGHMCAKFIMNASSFGETAHQLSMIANKVTRESFDQEGNAS